MRERPKKKEIGRFFTAESGGHAQRPFWHTSSPSLIGKASLFSFHC